MFGILIVLQIYCVPIYYTLFMINKCNVLTVITIILLSLPYNCFSAFFRRNAKTINEANLLSRERGGGHFCQRWPRTWVHHWYPVIGRVLNFLHVNINRRRVNAPSPSPVPVILTSSREFCCRLMATVSTQHTEFSGPHRYSNKII